MKIAFYISSHGYGHGVRQSFLINALPKYVTPIIISKLPVKFWNEEIEREFIYRNIEFDIGAIQIDSVTIDVEQTLEKYRKISVENRSQKIVDEVSFIKENRVSAIISDMVPFASVIALKAEIPSFAISNFTWLDIYSAFPQSAKRDEVCAILSKELSKFKYSVKLSPENSMTNCKGEEELVNINLLRKGLNRREELVDILQTDRDKKIVLLYIGKYGLENTNWENLDRFTDYHFFGYHNLENSSKNYTVINKSIWNMQDFSASSDLIIAKLGYGTVSESLSSGVPILYIPREGFAEFEVLESYLLKFGSCQSIALEIFKQFNFKNITDRLIESGRRKIVIKDSNYEISKWIMERIR